MDDIYNDDNLVGNNWAKFNVVGDNINGTLIAVREMKSRLPGKEGEMVKVYEIKADGGEFHDSKDKKIIEVPIKIQPNEFWNVGGGFILDAAMRNIKLGQKIGIKYTGDKASKQAGFNPMKIKKVFVRKNPAGVPVMDEAWLEEQRASSLDVV